MKTILALALAVTLSAAAVTTACAAPATPDQVGTYLGTAKKTYYDLGSGQKITETVTCIINISEINNTIDFIVGSNASSSAGCPLTSTMGGYYHGITNGPALTATFKFSGSGDKKSIKGEYQYVNPYVLENGTFKLKKTIRPL